MRLRLGPHLPSFSTQRPPNPGGPNLPCCRDPCLGAGALALHGQLRCHVCPAASGNPHRSLRSDGCGQEPSAAEGGGTCHSRGQAFLEDPCPDSGTHPVCDVGKSLNLSVLSLTGDEGNKGSPLGLWRRPGNSVGRQRWPLISPTSQQGDASHDPRETPCTPVRMADG